jgi:hypothetical protein
VRPLYQFTDYREALRETLLDRKARHGRAFTFTKMAAACRLQRPYLSSVLGGSGHLSSDQVFEAAGFLQLDDDEYRYLSTLHELERSTSQARRRRLQRELQDLRDKGMRGDSVVEAPALAAAVDAAQTEFYLDLNAQLLHMFLTVKRYRNDPERARRALALGLDAFQAALAKIERAGLARVSGKRVEILRDAFHLPSTSPLYPAYRTMMRLKALDVMQSQSTDRHFSFSVLYSADAGSRPKIQSRFLELVDWAQKLTQTDAPTDVFQMNFDLVQLSGD